MKNKLVYDYIVVGTGPGGAVIAKTLTDDKQTSVLVLEAGENNDKDKPIRDSTFAPELEEQFFPEYFWQGEGIPQNGVDDRSFEWTTGRLLGGGSSINGEQYVRPTSAVFREWEKLLGPLWSPRRAIRRFKKLEKYNGETNNPRVHGYSGRIDIRQAPVNPTSMAQKLTLAIERATGFPEILDYNDPKTPLGPFTRWQLFQKPNGRRESSSTAFLSPGIMTSSGQGVNGRKLRVFFKSTTLRVLFTNKRAVGVEFLREGICTRAYARKKVIVSAGINSAQLLMLSGIGPEKSLKDKGIHVVFNNPNVGKRLRNHTLNFASFSTNPRDRALPSNDPNALYTGGAFLPDPNGTEDHRRAVQMLGIGSEGMLTLGLIYLRPASWGSIKLQNNDPLKIVLADEGFLSNPEDMEAVKNIYKNYVKNIAAELTAIDPSYQLVSPTLDVIDNDSSLEEFIKQNFGHNHHQQGSLRMAPLNRGGVVDRRGNVHGVKNLIVADASIIPFTVDGNTSAAAYLIGYTIARQLKLLDKNIRARKWIRPRYEENEE
ncbi:GMC family oxidoreductase [Paenibacillus sp. CMAA1739]|uniref:GMC family oxidoreductase n=1 Tax=Paenibacillus ottowii TaxID=2315729 RepID=UPI002730CF0D|nr:MULTISPECIES: GMC family oxidoreductase [Paenibacillus]MDP1512612.1 GMC family oxidoreductase [Paenibacillus ottowii]MEC4568597.1 GMC family oxidoreductase [Paenibacillus sp. CMAA1739]